MTGPAGGGRLGGSRREDHRHGGCEEGGWTSPMVGGLGEASEPHCGRMGTPILYKAPPPFFFTSYNFCVHFLLEFSNVVRTLSQLS